MVSHSSGGVAAASCAKKLAPENPAARAAEVLRKLRRLGKHSDVIMAASVHRRAGANCWKEQVDHTAKRLIRATMSRSEDRAPARRRHITPLGFRVAVAFQTWGKHRRESGGWLVGRVPDHR